MYCEWRQYPGQPYCYVGPIVAINGGTLSAAGTPMMAVPLGEWFPVEIASGQGNRADGTWQLTRSRGWSCTAWWSRNAEVCREQGADSAMNGFDLWP